MEGAREEMGGDELGGAGTFFVAEEWERGR